MTQHAYWQKNWKEIRFEVFRAPGSIGLRQRRRGWLAVGGVRGYRLREFSNIIVAFHGIIIYSFLSYRKSQGISNTSRHISFEFLFIKTCPPDKLHNGFCFVVQFRVGIRYLSCKGASLIKRNSKEMWWEVLLMPLLLQCTSLTRVLKQGQKDNALSYVHPELLNTIMGLRTKLLAPTKCISVCSVSWWSFWPVGLLSADQVLPVKIAP